ncbi:alpha/beta-hydrolase [Trametes cingulata]|nr:alpha/beta-hydrolase [Trametes cingulata]
MKLEATHFTLPGLEEDGGLVNTLVRYRPTAESGAGNATAAVRLSLVLLHAVAAHKEVWLPTLEHLFELQRTVPTNAFTIVEAWAPDSPNHGAAAALNEERLLAFPNGLTGSQWARAIQVFLRSGLIAPGCAVVGVGHSAGACILVQSTDGYAPDALPYASLIMLEPPMATPETLRRAEENGELLPRAADIARVRKDVWPGPGGREAARAWFAKRLPWSRWDGRVLGLFIEHGLRDLPTALYPDKREGVTLAAARAQEAGGYSHHEDAFAAMERLREVCPAIPVHCVFGEVNDFASEELQAAIVDGRVGRRMRSVVRVKGAGHWVVQEDPRGCALAMWGILHEDYARPVGAPTQGADPECTAKAKL